MREKVKEEKHENKHFKISVLHGRMARAECPKKDEFHTPNRPIRTGRFCLRGVSKK